MGDKMKYEIKTLKDVFDKVPSDRIEDCLKELAISMIQAKALNELMKISSERDNDFFDWPEQIEWLDDGKHEISLSFYETCNNKEFLRVETKLCKDIDA